MMAVSTTKGFAAMNCSFTGAMNSVVVHGDCREANSQQRRNHQQGEQHEIRPRHRFARPRRPDRDGDRQRETVSTVPA